MRLFTLGLFRACYGPVLLSKFQPEGTGKLGGQMPLPTSITSSDALLSRATTAHTIPLPRGRPRHGRFRRRRGCCAWGRLRLSPGRMILPVHNSRSPFPFLRRPVLRRDAGGAAHARAPACGRSPRRATDRRPRGERGVTSCCRTRPSPLRYGRRASRRCARGWS